MSSRAVRSTAETPAPASNTYERLAEVFTLVYAETHDIAIALEVVDTHRARELILRPVPDLPQRVLVVAAALFQVPASRLLRPGRQRDVCSARWIAAWLLRQGGWSTLKIGRFLHLDHSTVLHGLRRVGVDPGLLLAAREAADRLGSALVPANSNAIE
jgi:hypothetical protein